MPGDNHNDDGDGDANDDGDDDGGGDDDIHGERK